MLKKLPGVLGHPFFLVIATALLGSLLIPPLSDSINQKKVLNDARLRKAIEIVNNNTRTITQLNSMVTRLSSFHSNNIRRQPSPAKLQELQDKLIEDMDSRWSEFDKMGWWWYQDLYDEAVILGIIQPGESGKLRRDIDAYHDNILKTSNAMKLLWNACKAGNYNFKDGTVDKARDEMNQQLNALFKERIQLVSNLVSDFTVPVK